MKPINKLRKASIALAALLAVAPACAVTPWSIDWWTLDGGGEMFTAGGDWQLSGTIGQWDSTAHTQASGEAWQLTGGFWAITVSESDLLFNDSFE